MLEQPAAYNLDKVVKRLEEMRLKREEQLRACVDNDMADYFRCKMSAIAEAIEIVKSGGIEWNQWAYRRWDMDKLTQKQKAFADN